MAFSHTGNVSSDVSARNLAHTTPIRRRGGGAGRDCAQSARRRRDSRNRRAISAAPPPPRGSVRTCAWNAPD